MSKKLAVSDETHALIAYLAEYHHLSRKDTVANALALAGLVHDAMASGGEVSLRGSDGETYTLVFGRDVPHEPVADSCPAA